VNNPDFDALPATNVLGGELQLCSSNPVTGYYRDGCCNTCEQDVGSHTVCVAMSTLFLEFSSAQGNDLSTPRPEFGFSGLKVGDAWCLCASRWLDAFEAGAAPKVYLLSTHQKALEIIPLGQLKSMAIDLH